MPRLLNWTERTFVWLVNTVDIAEVLERQAEIEAAIQAANAANGYSGSVLMITDIVNSLWILPGSNMDKVKQLSTSNLKTITLSFQVLFRVRTSGTNKLTEGF